MSNVFALSCGAACEPAKFIVQVVGKDHPSSQRLVIYDEANMQEQEWLTKQDRPEVQTSDTFSSVLHIWDWENQPKRNLWLEIATSEGSPIRLPLLEDIRPTPRQSVHHTQWNQIVPIVPMTALPGSKSEQDLGTPVLVRSGYIYVFYRGKLWRELEVRVSDGRTTYHDVDIRQFRQEEGFRHGARQASGTALDDIWVPVQWNGFHTADVQMCFSEVQLNAVRLQRLEQDNGLRRSRCQSFDLRASREKFGRLYKDKPDGLDMLEAFSGYDFHDVARRAAAQGPTATRLNLAMHVFPVTLAAPQRQRQPGYEWLLDHPARYICDLSGEMPQEAQSLAQAFSDSCEAANPAPPDLLLETSALQTCVEKYLSPSQADENETPEQTGLWQAHSSETDVLQAARTRQLCAVLLEDPMYRIRHLKQRIETQQMLLQNCIRRAALYPHHGSALLLQQMVVPRTIGGQLNPLHESLKKLSKKGRSDINRFTVTPERMLARDHLARSQQLLGLCLDNSCYQQALADHLSLDGFEYLAEFYFTSQLLPLLAASPAQLDTLAPSGRIADAVNDRTMYASSETPGQRLINRLADDDNHPLHKMLWPEVDLASLTMPYQKPAEPNAGDGRFRPDELAAFENEEAPAGEPTTLNAAVMAGLLKGGSLSNALVASAKSGANALHQIHANLLGAVNAAQEALEQAQDLSRTADRDLDHAQRRLGESQRDLAQARRQTQAAEQAQQQAQAAEQRSAEEAQRRAQQLGQARQAEQSQRSSLASQARPARLRLHGMGLEQLRGMLRESFGEAVLIRKGAANAGTYYVFGLDDLPADQQRPVRMYGEYLDSQGNLLASSNQRVANRAGLPQVSGDYWVLALPRTHKTAQSIKELNQAVINAMLAERSSAAAQDNFRRASSAARGATREAIRARMDEILQEARVRTASADAATARQNAHQARSGLQDAAKHLKSQQDNPLFRALNGKVFPAGVMMLELYNLKLELGASQATTQEKGKSRTRLGTTGAVLDLLVAMEALTYKMAGNNSIVAVTRVAIFTLPELKATRWLGAKLSSEVVRDVTARLMGQTAAGLVMVGICLYDAWHAWRWNDDAMWGYLMMASGAAVGVVGGFFVSGSALLGPFGWVALLLIGTGAGVVYWLSNTPLEDWLGNGPFGDNTRHPHLLDPDEAFYRLIGLFAGPTIKVETNPLYNPDAKLLMHDPVPYAVRKANTVIRIETHLPGLLGSQEGASIRAECRLHSTETVYQRGNPPMTEPVLATDLRKTTRTVIPAAQIAWPGSLLLYVSTPASRPWNGNYSDTSLHHEWYLRVQARVELPEDIWVFPAPAPKIPLRNAASQAFSAQPEVFYPITAAQEL